MKTLLQICQYIGKTVNTGLDEITTLADVDDEQLNALNEALTLIWNYDSQWQLRFAKTTFSTVIGQSAYDMVNGNIEKGGLTIAGSAMPLKWEPNKNFLTPSSGTPDRYYIEGDDLVLYPTPDSVKVVTVKYMANMPVKGADLVEKDFFDTETDTLNIPARLEKYFISCLAHLTNKILNGDQTDAEYLEHDFKFKEFIKIIKNADSGSLDNTARFIF